MGRTKKDISMNSRAIFLLEADLPSSSLEKIKSEFQQCFCRNEVVEDFGEPKDCKAYLFPGHRFQPFHIMENFHLSH